MMAAGTGPSQVAYLLGEADACPTPEHTMKTVQKTALLWYSARQMYDLVIDVARYPEFLPWCDHTRIIEQDEHGMTAEIGMAFKALRQSFVTRNTHVPGREVTLQLVRGPFSRLQGHWTFTPVGDADDAACRIELTLSYAFKAPMAAIVGPLFNRIAKSLVDAFVKRAEQVYGAASA